MSVLSNCVFVIDKSIPLKKKVELIKLIKANGGASVYSVSPKATHLVTSLEGCTENSSKVDSAKKLGIHIVSKEFVLDSISQGAKSEEKHYYFNPQATSPSVPHQAISPQSTPSHAPSSPKVSSPKISHTVSRAPPGFAPLPHITQNGTGRTALAHSGEPTHSDPDSPYNSGAEYTDDKQLPAAGDDEEDSDGQQESEVYASDRAVYYNPPQRGMRQDDRRGGDSDHGGYSSSGPYRRGTINAYRKDDEGCKIFVGGIMLDDLDALRKTKDGFTDSPDVISHIQRLKQERLLEIIKIFNRFGNITKVKQFLDNRHIFISFDSRKSATTAIRELKPLEIRKKIIQEVRERLRAEGRQSLIAPRANFYVRWPNKMNSNSQSESGRSDGEGSWRRRASYGDNDAGYGSNSSVFSQSESESDQQFPHSPPRYAPPNRYFPPTIYESDGSDSAPHQDVRMRRAIGSRMTPSPPPISTTPPNALSSSSSSITSTNTNITNTSMSTTPPTSVEDAQRRDWLGLWSKIIILFQVIAIMVIVYFYNRGGF